MTCGGCSSAVQKVLGKLGGNVFQIYLLYNSFCGAS